MDMRNVTAAGLQWNSFSELYYIAVEQRAGQWMSLELEISRCFVFADNLAVLM